MKQTDRRNARVLTDFAVIVAVVVSFCAPSFAGNYVAFDRMCRDVKLNWDKYVAQEESDATREKRLQELELNLAVIDSSAPREGLNEKSQEQDVENVEQKEDDQIETNFEFDDATKLPESKILLPEDQERAIQQRREKIEKLFTALEIRREMRRLEEERQYQIKLEEEIRRKRSEHVSTATFGHTYHREFHYRGASRRADRLEKGMGIGEYYGGNWKQVPVDLVVDRAMSGLYPHRARKNSILYGKQSLGQTYRQEWERTHLIPGPDGRPISASRRQVRY